MIFWFFLPDQMQIFSMIALAILKNQEWGNLLNHFTKHYHFSLSNVYKIVKHKTKQTNYLSKISEYTNWIATEEYLAKLTPKNTYIKK